MREVVHKTVLFLYFVTTLAPLFDYLFNNIRDFLPFLCFFEGSLYTSAQYKSLYDTYFEGKSKPWFHTKVLFALNLIEWVKDNIAHRETLIIFVLLLMYAYLMPIKINEPYTFCGAQISKNILILCSINICLCKF